MGSMIKQKLRFNNSGYYFIGLFVLVILGFWPSYSVKFFNGTANFRFYIHFHAMMMILYISALILQPILIIKKQLPLHKAIGKLYCILVPITVILFIILLIHSGHTIGENDLGNIMFGQSKNLMIL
jgi:hypothetical protein